MREFVEKLALALAPIVVAHVLDVRKERIKRAETPPEAESFEAYKRARR